MSATDLKPNALLAAIANALITADLLADDYHALTGVRVGPFYRAADLQPVAGTPPAELPIWDADGVSQPMGPYGLVMLRDVEEARPRIAEASPKHAEEMPHLFACAPGLAKLEPGSDAYWIVRTEISWAAMVGWQTNPMENLLVNVYDIQPAGDPSALPVDRLRRRYQEYVAGAMAFGPALKTAKACAAQVLEYTRTKMVNDAIPDTDAIDFSPARPRPGKG